MKKFYIMVILAIIGLISYSQTLITEDFSGGVMPPSGWSIDAHAANWSISNSVNAGGIAPEAKMNWSPQFNDDSRLISPLIDLTGASNVVLQFRHMLDDYSGTAYSIGVATTSQGSGVWNIVWEVSPTGNIAAEEKILEITNDDVGQADFQFCIYFSGNSYNMDGWFIDDIVLFRPYGLDCAMSLITTYPYLNGPAEVTGKITNVGNTTITDIDINWQANGGIVNITNLTGLNLNLTESYNFTCTDIFNFPVGSYNLKVWLSNVNGINDDNPANDTLSKHISVVSHTVANKPCLEEFTSSTCGPCATLNTTLNPWLETHADELTFVKYQMDWPGNGDPYYTEEGGVRRNYYGVSYVPWVNVEGSLVSSNTSAIQAAVNAAAAEPTYVSLVSSHQINGTEITVNAAVLPFAGFTDFRAHIIVMENTTYGNVASNGETEFHHVMMKMIPDADGSVMNTTDREPVNLDFTVDLIDTFIEEIDDLSVLVLFQEFGSKKIFQSAYSVENGVFATEAHLSDLTYDGVQVPGFDPQVFDYTIELAPGTTDVPLVEGIPVDDKAIVVVVPAHTLPGTTVVDVFAEDLMTHNRYSINWDIETGIKDPENRLISVYPNPTTGIINLGTMDNGEIMVYSLNGELIKSIRQINSNIIDLSQLTNGIYILEIRDTEGVVYHSKVAVLK